VNVLEGVFHTVVDLQKRDERLAVPGPDLASLNN
jgi:hypothetical protein